MINYEIYCKIHDARRQGLNIVQIARALEPPETVSKWLRVAHFRQRQRAKHASCLDPYKGLIVRWLDTHPLSAQQIFQRLREAGYPGGISILKDYVRQVRPPQQKSFLKLAFAPGECAQVDWGEYGSIAMGRRSPAPELLRVRAVLLPADVCRVHRLADEGAFPRLSRARLRSVGRARTHHGG